MSVSIKCLAMILCFMLSLTGRLYSNENNNPYVEKYMRLYEDSKNVAVAIWLDKPIWDYNSNAESIELYDKLLKDYLVFLVLSGLKNDANTEVKSFDSEKEIVSQIRLIDSSGRQHKPLKKNKLDSKTAALIELARISILSSSSQYKDQMYLVVFNNKLDGSDIVNVSGTDHFLLKINGAKLNWATPVIPAISDEVDCDVDNDRISSVSEKIILQQTLGSTLELSTLAVSPDARHIACAASLNDKLSVIVDGQPGKLYDNLAKSIALGAGNRVGYLAQSNEKWMAVVDNTEGKYYSTLSSKLVFSRDGKRFAYGAQENDKWLVVVDNKEIAGRHDTLGEDSIFFSPDNKRVAYMAKDDDEWYIVVDSTFNSPHENVGNNGVIFSPNSKHYAYFALDKGQWTAVIDGKSSAAYDEVGIESLSYSPDSQKIAFIAKDEGQSFLVINGKNGPSYDKVANISFSTDSHRVAYIAAQGDKFFAVVDGVEGTRYPNIANAPPVFSLNGKRTAYAAFDDAEDLCAVVDGVEQKKYYNIITNSIVFSPDSYRIAYAAMDKDKNLFVVVDGLESQKYPGLASLPQFSPDSKKIVYTAKLGKGVSVIVNGKRGKIYDSLMSDIVFDSHNKFHYIASDGNLAYLVEETVK